LLLSLLFVRNLVLKRKEERFICILDVKSQILITFTNLRLKTTLILVLLQSFELHFQDKQTRKSTFRISFKKTLKNSKL